MNLLAVVLQAQGGADYSFLIMMVAIFAIMYFFMIRPQNKKQKEIGYCGWYLWKNQGNRR